MGEWLYLLVGASSGLLAGLFGIGGGAIIVPILIFVFAAQQLADSVHVHLAVGTSFAVIVVTALSSVVAHHRLGNVRWSIFRSMAPGLVLGVALGSLAAAQIGGEYLQRAIGVFLFLVALQMFFSLQPRRQFSLPGRGVQLTAGGLIGAVSAFFGIAGGSLTVPYLNACRQPIKYAIATSAACGLPIALVGALMYGYQGLAAPDLPPWSTGYIYWPAFFGIALISAPCARLGAQLSAGLSERLLKQAFALLLAAIGLRLLWPVA